MDYKTIERACEALKTARDELIIVKEDTEDAVEHQLLTNTVSKLNKSIVELEIIIRARK